MAMNKALVVLLVAVVALCAAGPLATRMHELKPHLNAAHKTFQRVASVHKAMGVSDLSVECALCGVAVNEVEGLLAENATETEIAALIKKDICSTLGTVAQFMCDEGVTFLPDAIERIEKKYTVSAVCIDVGLCQHDFATHPDPQDVPTVVINMDLAPEQRLAEVCSTPKYQQIAQFLVGTVDAILPGGGASVSEIGELLNDMYFPAEYAGEIRGCAKHLGVSTGWMALFSLGYELSDACTSIVAQNSAGEIIHGRNMDFWSGMGFTDSLKNMTIIADYQSKGKTVFKSTTFPGYPGCLSCQRPDAFSATVDTRFHPDGIGGFFYEVVAAIEERNASLTTFLVRDVVQNEATYADAVSALSTGELIDDVYYIVAGVAPGEGTVLSRNRTGLAARRDIDSANGVWYVIETNYDWDEPAPWFDDRRQPGIDHLDNMGQGAMSPANMMKIMSMKPTLNLQSTYTIVSVPKTSLWESYARWCPFPCTQ